MGTLIGKVLGAARNYTILDFAFFKITLFSLGLLGGVYFAETLQRHTFELWVVFIVSYVWIMYRTFVKHMN